MTDDIRILSVSIHNFKNISFGQVELDTPDYFFKAQEDTDIIGIYGPNGSGKSSIIEASSIIRHVLSKGILPDYSRELIKEGCTNSTITINFLYKIGEDVFQFIYTLSFAKNPENKRARISSEVLEYKKWIEEKKKFSTKQIIAVYNSTDTKVIRNETAHNVKSKKSGSPSNVKLFPAKVLVQLYGAALSNPEKSFFFSSFAKNLISEISSNYSTIVKNEKMNILKLILTVIPWYSSYQWLVLSSQAYSENYLINMLPVSMLPTEEFDIAGSVPIIYENENTVPQELYPIIEQKFQTMNLVLNELIPDMQILPFNPHKATAENGLELIEFEIVCEKKNQRIPLKYESDGIKRIISILDTLIAAVNNPFICVMIDELDSGIFEYLLGEIIEVLTEIAKGQILFTAHNLHPLEKLYYQKIYFTSTNVEDAYIKLKNIKKTNNLRDTYYRTLILSADSDQYMEPIREGRIRFAFRKAGKV